MIHSRRPRRELAKKGSPIEKNAVASRVFQDQSSATLSSKAADVAQNQRDTEQPVLRLHLDLLFLSRSSEMRRQSIAGLHRHLLFLRPGHVTVLLRNAHMFTQQTHTSVGIRGRTEAPLLNPQ